METYIKSINEGTNSMDLFDKKELVSIIIPVYNTEKYIAETIKSIQAQTYKKWEAIFIDDCSIDDSSKIIHDFMKNDKRLRYFKTEQNSGAAVARNKGVKEARGNFISFLDDDDLWYSEKLEKQIEFMKENNYSFVCSYYDKIDEQGRNLGVVVKNKSKLNYNRLLKNNPGNSTVMYNSDLLGKTYIPSIRKRNDYIMWLRVIKKAKSLNTIPIVLASHRVRTNSLSSNKRSLVKYHWIIYRKHERLGIIRSIYLITHYAFKTILAKFKYLVMKRKKR